MSYVFPRTAVAGVSLSRMIIGTNWLLGWSHRSSSADEGIKARYSCADDFFPILEAYTDNGVDTLMAPISTQPLMIDAINNFREKSGRSLILVDTPILNVDDNQTARKEAEKQIRYSASLGCKFCLIHHSSAEQLVNKNKRTIERISDYTQMIREAGMIPGLSAHMPELIVYSDQNGYDIETYIQIYNCMGFLMQVEIETVASIIHNAKKPVMTIKSMAAGRTTPYVGLSFSFATLRDCDMVTVGASSEKEALEDIEISMAILERRFPGMKKRSSPNNNQSAFGKN